MKFRVAREDFAESVAWVARSLPSRPPVPVLGGVLLVADEDGLTVSGFDYEVSAQMRVAAEVAGPGQVLVSGRLLADITKALSNKPVDVSVDGTRVLIACGSNAKAGNLSPRIESRAKTKRTTQCAQVSHLAILPEEGMEFARGI